MGKVTAETLLKGTKAERELKVYEARAYLRETDYAVIKIAEGVATKEEYSEVLAKRAEARKIVNGEK